MNPQTNPIANDNNHTSSVDGLSQLTQPTLKTINDNPVITPIPQLNPNSTTSLEKPDFIQPRVDDSSGGRMYSHPPLKELIRIPQTTTNQILL